MAVQTISGNFASALGVDEASRIITFRPVVPVWNNGAEIIVGEVFEVTTNGAGEASTAVEPGQYVGTVTLTYGRKDFTINVGTDGPYDWTDVVNETVPEQVAALLAQAEAARDAAQAAQTGAETAEANAEASEAQTLVYRNQTAVLAAAAGAPSGETLPPLAPPDPNYPVSSYFRLLLGPGIKIYRNDANSWVDTGIWERGPEFDTVALLLADTSASYGGTGVIVEAGGYRYEQAASGATDHRLTTAGGTKLYILPSADGTFSNRAGGSVATLRTQINTAEVYPSVFRALYEIKNNGELTNSLLVHSYWTGGTGNNYQNNDTVLFETHNDIQSDSTNYSWSISAPNAYNNIPEGVTDSGFRVGALGWATSVNKPGYTHAGTLAAQTGVWGRAGFQGSGSPATARVETATGVYGEVQNESLGHIESAFGVSGKVVPVSGSIRYAYGVFAQASGATDRNYSFYGAEGVFFNIDTCFFGTEYQDLDAPVATRNAGGASFEFGFPAPGYGSSLGATFSAGWPYLAFCARADDSGNTFTTSGNKGVVVYSALGGELIIGLLETASAAGQAPVEKFRVRDDGRVEFQEEIIIKANTAPASASDTGVQGEIRFDDNYMYRCIATNTWKRVALSTW